MMRRFYLDPKTLPPLPQGSRITYGFLPQQALEIKEYVPGLRSAALVRTAGTHTYRVPVRPCDADTILCSIRPSAIMNVEYVKLTLDGHIWEITTYLNGLILGIADIDKEAAPIWAPTECTVHAGLSNRAICAGRRCSVLYEPHTAQPYGRER